VTTVTLQQAFEACLNNKTAWLTRRQEMADTEQEYRKLIATVMTAAPGVCKPCARLST